jgi:phosphopantothenoylcysteine decarboxylase/phosphopantothenate--cysteine ligase
LETLAAVKFVNVVSAQDMFAAVKNEISSIDIFISVAAVADYRAISTSKQKTKKTGSSITLEFTPNPDILEYVANLANPPFCVGFAAETENLEANAEAKRRKKKLPLLAANLAQEAIGSDENALVLFDSEGEYHLPKASKIEQARLLIKHLASLCAKLRNL